MALRKNDNGFSLDLVVGIQDIFKQQKKGVEKEAKDLEKEFKKLQGTINNIDEFKKLQQQMKSLENQTDATEDQIQSLSDKLESSKMSLHRAGVSTSRLNDEQKRLANSLAKTSQEMKDQEKQLEEMSSAQEKVKAIATGVGSAVATGALVTKLSKAGIDRDKKLRVAAASTNTSLEDLTSTEAKRWRSRMRRQTGQSDEQIIAAQALAIRGTDDDKQAQAIAEQALKLSNQGMDIEEANAALLAMTKADSELSPKKAAAILDGMKKNGQAEKVKDITDSAIEYSGYIRDLGLDPKIAWAAALYATKGGALNTDKPMDALKEGIASRLSDPSELEKLLGKGKTQGSIDEYVTDADTRKVLKDSIGGFTTALAEGKSVAKPLADISSALLKLYDTNPQNAKVVAEGLFGVQGSEDLTKDGFMNFLKVLSGEVSADELLKTTRTLDESVELSQSALDDIATSGALFADSVINVMAEVTSSMKDATEEMKNIAADAADFGNEHQLLTGLTTAAAVILGGVLSYKKLKFVKGITNKGKDYAMKKFMGNGTDAIDDAAKAASDASKVAKGADAVDDAAKAANALKTGNADDVIKATAGVTDDAAKAATTSSILKKGTTAIKGGAGKVARKVPVLGAALNTLMIGSDILDKDYEAVFGDIGSILGGIGGGIAGTAIAPGVGTAAAGIGGSIVGDEIGRKLYQWLFGEDEDTKPTDTIQPQVEEVEDTVKNIQANSVQQFEIPGSLNRPPVTVTMENNFNIDVGLIDGEEGNIQEVMTRAFREITPEFQRQLKQTFEELYDSDDNIAISE